MHEVGIAESILDAVEKRAGGRPVARVRVRAGALLRVAGPSMDQAFELVSAGGVADRAALEVVTVPAEVACRACGHRAATEDPLTVCPACGGAEVDLSGGRDLVLESIEIMEERDVPGDPRRGRGDPVGPA
ncbi:MULTISPECIES: hydrogenase maturation nickel metallochaperone HypA [Thermomonosporaceae]|uniref:hydrogenase maturation nickel metallochaperone HypA/HybF n=1 Tax=Thermomonosporaceae TaxID=2012 RepID=UPI00255B3AC9|nr:MULTISPECIES: hydrogenase maturation nickel metallochaperone HypA [Thermomonosporaceae]MDL4774322.1 hydrogenase maturation nickel metallochaperone HypA [Actinomadura xylanilytica]